jgi:hypothetical protein
MAFIDSAEDNAVLFNSFRIEKRHHPSQASFRFMSAIWIKGCLMCTYSAVMATSTRELFMMGDMSAFKFTWMRNNALVKPMGRRRFIFTWQFNVLVNDVLTHDTLFAIETLSHSDEEELGEP